MPNYLITQFNTPGPLDSNLWGYDTGDGTNLGIPAGWGNKEAQQYTTHNALINHKGHLVIKACKNGQGQWESARVTTRDKFHQTYMRVDVKARLTNTEAGVFPAIWVCAMWVRG